MFQDEPLQDEWLDIEGRSKEDALERACNALNTTLPYLEYKIVGGNGSKIRARKLENPRVEPEARKEPRKEESRESREPREPREARPPRPEARPEEAPEEIRAEERPEELPLTEPTDIGIQAKELLSQVLKHIDDAAQVELRETTEEIGLEILGNGSGLFIGKRGATLEALQHLVAKMLGLDRRSGKRIIVDSEHYRKRRQETLEGLARKLASRARRERRPISVEPMSAIDRRILHLALQNSRDVMTKSVGEGSNRKVVVVPRDYQGDLESAEGADSGGRSSRGGRSRQRTDGRSGRPSGRRPEPARQPRKRPLPPGRMHDSFDVPSVPDDTFENDEDMMTSEEPTEEQPEGETTPPPPETSEEER